ncbi:hypothetical protein AGMMS50268_22250 [Spirochaetia bacterium]|nr:hypothetical protein AGMMS50268_22250 [Spirochaetia bacterium]
MLPDCLDDYIRDNNSVRVAESHPWLSETVENALLDTTSFEQWDARSGHHVIYTY